MEANSWAPIELECLAIAWAINKCRHFLLGANFTVLTDHRPLVGVFKKRDNDTNARLSRWLERVTAYNFCVEWVEGKTHYIADALSRAPCSKPTEEDIVESGKVARVRAVGYKDPKITKLEEIAEKDEEYSTLIETFKNRTKINDIKDPHHPAQAYKKEWHNISLDGKLLILKNRIVVPKSARKFILDKLHISHPGINRMMKSARDRYYWPFMGNDISQKIESCEKCLENSPSRPKSKYPNTTIAEHTLEQVSADLFEYGGKDYLLLADRYSGYPVVQPLRRTSTQDVTDAMEDWFLEVGYPKILRSDGGPQFRGKFKKFCNDNDIVHELSSPYHSEGNGHAEASVKNMKRLLEKTDGKWKNFRKALQEFRNTPKQDCDSPSEIMYGRRLRGELPTYEKQQQRSFNDGDRVRIQNQKNMKWTVSGKIIHKHEHGEAYDILQSNGKVTRRNGRAIRFDRTQTDVQEPMPEAEEHITPLRRSPRLQFNLNKNSLHNY